MIKEKEIQKVVDKIAKKYKPEKIILFGSFAWGKPTNDSDVDLFIVKETKNSRFLAMEIDDTASPRQFPMDVIVYTPKQVKNELNLEDPFISKVLQRGKVLFAEKK